MQALTLPSRRGWHWLVDAFVIFRRKQLMLSLAVLGYWTLMAVISALPLIGRIAAMLLIPAFSVSLMNACRVLEQGGLFHPALLVSGFRKNPRTLIHLGVLYLLASAAILGLVALLDDGVLFGLIFFGTQHEETVLASDGVRLGAQLALGLFTPLMAAYWFAPVLVAWHDLSAGKAIFFSFVACARNWRAFVVYCAAVVVFGALLPSLLAGLLAALVPGGSGLFSVTLSLLIIFLFLPTLYASFYVSYREVFVIPDNEA